MDAEITRLQKYFENDPTEGLFEQVYRQIDHPELAQHFIDNGANVDLIDDFGSTPLHVAVGGGCIEVVKVLLLAGAEVNLTDKKGRTALELADNDEFMISVLLEYGAE